MLRYGVMQPSCSLHGMQDGQHYQDDADMPVQENEGSEYSYETDSGTDSDEELHSGAEPYWVDVHSAIYLIRQAAQARPFN